jgi:hypothetical protein
MLDEQEQVMFERQREYIKELESRVNTLTKVNALLTQRVIRLEAVPDALIQDVAQDIGIGIDSVNKMTHEESECQNNDTPESLSENKQYESISLDPYHLLISDINGIRIQGKGSNHA